jgi:hypothetical protein
VSPRGGDTKAIILPGVCCALCGGPEGPGLNVPVFTPDGRPAFPRLCQDCLGIVLKVTLSLLGHAGGKVAAVAVSVPFDKPAT